MKKLLYMFTAFILSFILAACAGGSEDIWPDVFKENGKIDTLNSYYAYLAENVFSRQLDYIMENGLVSVAGDSSQAKIYDQLAQIYKMALDKLNSMDVADGLKSVHSVLIEYMETKAAAYETMYILYKSGNKDLPGNDSENAVNQANASQIATAYNAYMALNPNDTEMGTEKADFADVEALEIAIGASLWPRGLKEETADAAWEYVTIENGIGGVREIQPSDSESAVSQLERDITESFSDWVDAIKEYQKKNDLPEYTPIAFSFFEVYYNYTNERGTVAQANASMVATAFNAYNALNPNSMIPDSASLDEIKALLVDSGLWPSGLSDEDAEAAWDYITIKDNIARIVEYKKSDPEAGAAAARTNAGKIAEAINITNMFADGPIPRPAGAPDIPSYPEDILAKDMLPMLWYWWPADLTDDEVEDALDWLDYDGSGTAGVLDNK